MDNQTIIILSIGIEEDTVLILCLYSLHLRLFCSYRTTFHFGTPPCRLVQILKQAKLGQFSIYRIETGQYVHKNCTYFMIRLFNCTDLSIEYLKKERLCFKIVLGQAWFELYCASYYSPYDHSIVVRIRSACAQ